jgi:hypothetical protein
VSDDHTPQRPKRKPPEPDIPLRGSAPYTRPIPPQVQGGTRAAPDRKSESLRPFRVYEEGNPLSDFASEVVTALLRARPVTSRGLRAEAHREWPADDFEGAEYLYRGLARLLGERGGTVEVATEIRQDLQAGRLVAAVDISGELRALREATWRGDASRKVWWTGRAQARDERGVLREGNVYLLAAASERATAPVATPSPKPEPIRLLRDGASAAADCAPEDMNEGILTLGERERELWLQHLMRRETWNYAEALAWIVHRDPAGLGSSLGYGKAPLAESCADMVAATLTLYGRTAPTFEACPDKALLYALQAGDVKASGFDDGGHTRRVIPQRDWTDLALNGASPVSALILGDEPGRHAWMVGPPFPTCWRRVMFDRETVVATFQVPEDEAAPAPEPTPEPVKAKPDDLRPKERTSAYKLILGMAEAYYSYKPPEPGKRDSVVPEIVGDLERVGRAVSDETVRKWLADAFEALGEPDES